MVTRNISVLYLFNFLLDFRFYGAIVILYFAKVTGSFTLGMSIFSVTMLSSALFELPTGIISDMVGRKKTVIVGACMSVCALTFYAIGWSFWILVIGALFEGASRAFFSGNNEALLYETLKEKNREHEFAHVSGKTDSMFQIALGIASLLGGLIAALSFSFVMWVSVLPQIGCLILSFFIVEPKKVNHERKTNIYAHLRTALIQFKVNRKLRLLSLSSIIREAVGEAAFLFRPAFVNTLWPIWAIGLSATGSYLLSFLPYYFSGILIKRFSALKTLFGEIIINRIIGFIALLFPSVLSPALMTITSLFYGPGNIAMRTLMQKEFTNEQRATLGSLNSLGTSILFGISSIGLGIIADTYGPISALLLANIILLLPLFSYWELFKHDKNTILQEEK